MFSHHSLRLHWPPHTLPPALRGFLVHIFLQRVAEALLTIATPIALFEYGQHLPFLNRFFADPTKTGILAVMLFFIIERLTLLLFTAPLTKVFQRLGVAHTMVLGQLLLTSSLVLLPLIPLTPAWYLVAAALRGPGIFLYWVGHYTYFNSVAVPRHLGKEVGALEFLTKLATIIAPLLSAVLIVRFGFWSAFLTSAVLLATAAVTLFIIPNYQTRLDWNWSRLSQSLRQPYYRKIALSIAGFAWEGIGFNLFWPLFLFIAFGRIATVSYILSGATLLSLLIVYLTGTFFDAHHSSRRLSALTGIGLGIIWLPRILFWHFPLALVATETADRLLAGVYQTLFVVTLFAHARNENIFRFYVNREIILSLTVVIGFGLGIILLVLSWNWSLILLSFIAGILASLNIYSPDSDHLSRAKKG